MATGSLIVRSTTTANEDGASTSEKPENSCDESVSCSSTPSHSLPDLSPQRRHSMSFRPRHHHSSSSSDEDEDQQPPGKRRRKFSMDQHHKSRSMLKTQRAGQTGKLCRRTEVPSSTNSIDGEFLAPSPMAPKKNQVSRPSSPLPNTINNRPVVMASRHRLASIRRESDCGLENEVAHEKLVKTTQQVSTGFEDFCLDDRTIEERKRAKSLAEPISVFTNAFLPQSSSPSPTWTAIEAQKQCYSPSTQQMVRSNISYSPSPSPTPASPTRNRIMRSMSPIAVRQISKRRYTATGSLSGVDSDTESQLNGLVSAKRSCLVAQRNAASPLVRDSLSVQSVTDAQYECRSSSPLSVCSTSSFTNVNSLRCADVDSSQQNSIDFDENAVLDDSVAEQFYSRPPTDNGSTAVSSRADTPVDEQMMVDESPNCATASSSGSMIFGPATFAATNMETPRAGHTNASST